MAQRIRLLAKQNLWPRPDYVAWVKQGIPAPAAYIVRTIYNAIPRQPLPRYRSDAFLTHFESAVTLVRDACTAWLEAVKAEESWTADLAGLHHAEAEERARLRARVESPGGTATLLQRIFPSLAQEDRKWTQASWDHCIALGWTNRYADLVLYPSYYIADQTCRHGWPTPIPAWQRVYEVKSELSATKHGKWLSIENGITKELDHDPAPLRIELKRQDGSPYRCYIASDLDEVEKILKSQPKFWLARKHTWNTEFSFEAVAYGQDEEAMRQLAVAKLKDRRKAAPPPRPDEADVALQEHVRSGPSRADTPAQPSAEDLIQAFGLRAVNFGNWVPNAERRLHLRMAWDALHDLGHALSIEPRLLGLGGRLGLAVGAQGNGGRALAHFIPGFNEMNVSRRRGAGSLAHEWAHALDHYLAVFSDKVLRSNNPFLSENLWIAWHNLDKSSPKPLFKLFGDACLACTRGHYQDAAIRLDGHDNARSYWAQGKELFARAFESFVLDRLADQGIRSDYLVRDIKAPSHADKYSTYPYPAGKERASINAAFAAMLPLLREYLASRVDIGGRHQQGQEYSHASAAAK